MKKIELDIFVVSLDYEGMGADRLCYDKKSLEETKIEYKDFLVKNRFNGKVSIHKYEKKNYPKEIFDDEQIFFDNFFDPMKDIVETYRI